MASAGNTPIQLYYSNTAGNQPAAANLIIGELALNVPDGKLFYLNSSNVVSLLVSANTNANTIYSQGVDNTQNTNIQSAWNTANNALANTSGLLQGSLIINSTVAGNAFSIIAEPYTPVGKQTWTFATQTGLGPTYPSYMSWPDGTRQLTAFTGTAIDQTARNTANNALSNIGPVITTNSSSVVYVSNTTVSTSNSTGALVVGGGLGVSGNINSDMIYTSDVILTSGSTIGGSANFNNGTEKLSLTSATLPIASGQDFTIEAFVYRTTSSTIYDGILSLQGDGGDWNSGGHGFVLAAGCVSTAELGQTAYSSGVPTNVWTHIAAVRYNNVLTVYIDGTSVYSTSSATGAYGNGGGHPAVGVFDSTRYGFYGNITNLRVVIGTAIYTSGGFSVPTSPLTVVSNTQFLLSESDSSSLLVDSSTNNYSITNNGTVTWSSLSPFTGSLSVVDVGQTLTSVSQKSNSALILANSAYNKANTVSGNTIALQAQVSTHNIAITATDTLARAAYNTANTGSSFVSNGGTVTGNVTISRDLTVQGNLTVLGNSTVITTSQLDIGDSLIYLANNNLTSDAVDIGIIGHYNDGTDAHTGIFRDPNLKEWIFFKGYTPEVQSNNLINIAHPSFAYSNVYAGYFKGNLVATQANITKINTSNVSLINGTIITDTIGRALSFGSYEFTQTPQGDFAVAVGPDAGWNNQGSASVAIGPGAGYDTQAAEATAVGDGAGSQYQNYGAVAVGFIAGQLNQGQYSVAIGSQSGTDAQGNNAVAIGWQAGGIGQGTNSIAIGKSAGVMYQPNNSIILNATGLQLDVPTTGLYVDPVRNDIANTNNAVYYNSSTKELTYGPVVDSVARGTNLTQNTAIAATDTLARAAFAKANTGGGGSSGGANTTGWLANSIIFADTTGTLSNTSNLQYFSSNNYLRIGEVPLTSFYVGRSSLTVSGYQNYSNGGVAITMSGNVSSSNSVYGSLWVPTISTSGGQHFGYISYPTISANTGQVYHFEAAGSSTANTMQIGFASAIVSSNTDSYAFLELAGLKSKLQGQLLLTNTTQSTSQTTGALVVSGGVGIGGTLTSNGTVNFINGETNIAGLTFQYNTGSAFTGVTSFTPTVWSACSGYILINTGTTLTPGSGQAANSNTTGMLRVAGGMSVKGNIYSGGIYVTGSSNGVTFPDGTKQTTAYTGGTSGASASGYLPNAVIVANSTGYLSNSSGLLYHSSNTSLKVTGTVVVANSSSGNTGSIVYNATLNSFDFIFN